MGRQLNTRSDQAFVNAHKIADNMTAWAKLCTAAAKSGASSDHSYLYDDNGLPI